MMCTGMTRLPERALTGAEYDLPDYYKGYLENGILCYVVSDSLYWMGLERGESDLPSDGDWNYRVLDDTGVQIYYEPARQSGDGGNLVTIRAYDWGDNAFFHRP